MFFSPYLNSTFCLQRSPWQITPNFSFGVTSSAATTCMLLTACRNRLASASLTGSPLPPTPLSYAKKTFLSLVVMFVCIFANTFDVAGRYTESSMRNGYLYDDIIVNYPMSSNTQSYLKENIATSLIVIRTFLGNPCPFPFSCSS